MNKENMCVKMIKGKENEKSEKPSVYRQWMTAIWVNSILVTYGLQSGWVSPMIKTLQSDISPIGRPLTDSEISWLAGIMCLCAMAGVPLYTYISDSYGRKRGILAIAVPQALSWIILLFAKDVATLITARAICGIAAGGCFNVIPMYVKEISQDHIRGTLATLIIVFQNIGILGVYAMGAYFDYYLVLWVVTAVPIVTLPFLLRTPESPAFLVKIGKVEEAAEVVGYLRGLDKDNATVQKEIEAIKGEDVYFKSIPDMSFTAIFKVKPWRRGFVFIFLILSCHALNGCLVITSYAASMLASSGVTVSPELQSLSFPVVMILATLLSMSIVEKFGRKPILIFAFILAAASMFSIGTIVLLQQQGYHVPAWLTVGSMIGAVAAYAGGVSPVPYVILSEIFNFQIRAKLIGILVTNAWLLAFVQLIVFGPISRNLGQHTAYYIHAGINLLAVAFVLLIPETKGKTIDQIEDELSRKK